MDITKQVVEKLKESSPLLSLFLDTHFELVTEESLVPSYSGDKIIFPTRTYLKAKDLTIQDKITYYLTDLELYLKENKK